MRTKFTDVKYLKERESLVQNKNTGKIGVVVRILISGADNYFTVRYATDGKYEGFCEPKDFYLVTPAVKGMAQEVSTMQ